jgi:serine protease inhibitor
MKQISLLFCLLLVTMTAAAYEGRRPMLAQGKTWYYTYHQFEEKDEPTDDPYPYDFYNETLHETSYTLKGDTVIDGRTYMKMYRRFDWGKLTYYAAMREDEQGRVWQWDYEGDKKDYMLCDFTCQSYPEIWGEVSPVEDVINIYGQLLHRYQWNGMLGVEGVGMAGKGLVHYLFEPEPDCICDYESLSSVEGDDIFFTASDFYAPKYIELTKEEKQLVKNNNDFAFRLFNQVRNPETSNLNPKGSMVLSPLSITYALGMVNNGAVGQTQQEISDVLGFDDVSAQNEFCLKMTNELLATGLMDRTTKANISNTIFVNKGMGWQLKPDFTNNANHYYYASPQDRDFTDGETRDVINQWASDHTEGMIKEVLSEPEFNPFAVSYLLNAIYFKGMWSNPFKAEDTKDEPFAGGDPVPMMHNKNVSLEYAENANYQTVRLPYGNGSYRMQVFLPREGKTVDDVLASLTADHSLLTTYYSHYDVDLKLPRFGTDTDVMLKGIMSALGMPTAFSPVDADFSNLCEENDLAEENIYIGMMKQVAKIEVNEEGTEAAAVTVIGYETTGMPKTATFHADRPFLYVISEQSTGIIFFMGQYMGKANDNLDPNPTEDELVKSNNDFAFRLFREARNDKNMVLSPLSITYALGMLNNGATGQTLEEINKTLGFGSPLAGALGADGINQFCHNLMQRSSTLDKDTKVMIANNIYVNEALDCNLLPEFVEKAESYYNATPESLDFFDDKTLDIINQWASDNTEGMIEEALHEEEFNPMTLSYLLNALYFKAEWTLQFMPEMTMPMAFNGGSSEVQMMTQDQDFLYAENDLYQSIILPYGNKAYQMTVFLPQKGKTVSDVLQKMNGADWNADNYEHYQVHLQLPRFESTTDVRLEDIMSALGMPSAFNPATAHFENFCDSEGVFIDMMKQVAKINVNESGTEASAVTIIGIGKSSPPSNPNTAEFIANRPFLYVISERDSGVIYFMGQFMGDGKPGDINGDSTVDVADIAEVISIMASGEADPVSARAGDVNGDGVVDVADISYIISIMTRN